METPLYMPCKYVLSARKQLALKAFKRKQEAERERWRVRWRTMPHEDVLVEWTALRIKLREELEEFKKTLGPKTVKHYRPL